MNLERYEFATSATFLDFEFKSKGPKGVIRKIVRYSPQHSNGITYFNLAFGDLNEKNGKIDDRSVSDNKDRGKVLATVAATVIRFVERFPDAKIYAKGSTKARTRLYQIAIAANWQEISAVLDVFGFYKGRWERFTRNVNYEAFLATRKNS